MTKKKDCYGEVAMNEQRRREREAAGKNVSWRMALMICGAGLAVLGLVQLIPDNTQKSHKKQESITKKIAPCEGAAKIGMICPGFKEKDDLKTFSGLSASVAEQYVTQKQRIRIATVFFKNTPVTIVDSTWDGLRKVIENKTGHEWWICGEWLDY